MNPYHVLGINSDASDAEIKAAYRNAVKKHHPDATGKHDTHTIALINEAYEILSNAERRRAYDSGIYQFTDVAVPEEDPREVYRREYRRKVAEERREKLEREKKLFRSVYKINVIIFILSLVAVIDERLPSIRYNDHIIKRWETVRQVRAERYYIPYIQTEHCTFTIPEGTSTAFTAQGSDIMVGISPLFRIPTEAGVSIEGRTFDIKPTRTLYSFAIPFHYLVLIFSGVSVALRKHSSAAFQLSFAPSLILLMAGFILYILT